MDILEQVKSENKAIRRNALKQFVTALKAKATIDNQETLCYLQLLPFYDSYDTCRELSFLSVFILRLCVLYSRLSCCYANLQEMIMMTFIA